MLVLLQSTKLIIGQMLLFEQIGIIMTTQHLSIIINKILHFKRKRISLIARMRRSQRVQTLRETWRNEVWNHDINEFIFIDENHFDFRDLNCKYGRFLVGEQAEWSAGHVSREPYSLIMAISRRGVEHWYLKDTKDEGIKSVDFIEFLEKLFLNLGPYTRGILVLDNAAIHHSELTEHIMDEYHIPLLYLPPYSPHYNPIELCFGEMKRNIKEVNGTNMVEIIERSVQNLTVNNICNYYDHCFSNYCKNTF
jgi:transposase